MKQINMNCCESLCFKWKYIKRYTDNYCLCVTNFVEGQAEANAMLFFFIPFFASAIFNTQFTLFNRKFDDRMPKIADKNYTEKRLEILDEGERHIELIALFKTYAINLSILILAIIFIGSYSIATGINQSFSLLLIIAIFI